MPVNARACESNSSSRVTVVRTAIACESDIASHDVIVDAIDVPKALRLRHHTSIWWGLRISRLGAEQARRVLAVAAGQAHGLVDTLAFRLAGIPRHRYSDAALEQLGTFGAHLAPSTTQPSTPAPAALNSPREVDTGCLMRLHLASEGTMVRVSLFAGESRTGRAALAQRAAQSRRDRAGGEVRRSPVLRASMQESHGRNDAGRMARGLRTKAASPAFCLGMRQIASRSPRAAARAWRRTLLRSTLDVMCVTPWP